MRGGAQDGKVRAPAISGRFPMAGRGRLTVITHLVDEMLTADSRLAQQLSAPLQLLLTALVRRQELLRPGAAAGGDGASWDLNNFLPQ